MRWVFAMIGLCIFSPCVAGAASTPEAVRAYLVQSAQATVEKQLAGRMGEWTAAAMESVLPPSDVGGLNEQMMAQRLEERRGDIEAAMRERLRAALPELTRGAMRDGLLRGEGGSAADLVALQRQVETRIAKNDGARFDVMAKQWSAQTVDKIVACLRARSSDRGVDSGRDGGAACPIPQAVDPTDLRGTIDRVVQPQVLVDLVKRPLGEAIGEGTVDEIQERIGAALRGELPKELHDYLQTPINDFKAKAKLGEQYLPGEQLDQWKNWLKGKTVVHLPNPVYGAILANSAFQHFSKVICGLGCVNFYELNRGREVVQFLAWQLTNRKEIALNVGQMLSLVKYVGKELHIPEPTQWGKLGGDIRRVKEKVDWLQNEARKIDGWYKQGEQIVAARAEMIVGEFERELKELQELLLTPVQDVIDQTNEGFSVIRGKLHDVVKPWDEFMKKVRNYFARLEGRCDAATLESYVGRPGGSPVCAKYNGAQYDIVMAQQTSVEPPAEKPTAEQIQPCLNDSTTCALCLPKGKIAGVAIDLCDKNSDANNNSAARQGEYWNTQQCTIDLCALHNDERYQNLKGTLDPRLTMELARLMAEGRDDLSHAKAVGPGHFMTAEEGQYVVSEGKKWVGYPYIFGGNDGPRQMGVDCSHFVDRIFAKTNHPGPYVTATNLHARAQNVQHSSLVKLYHAGLIHDIERPTSDIEKLRALGYDALNAQTLAAMVQPDQLARLRQNGFPDVNAQQLNVLLENNAQIVFDGSLVKARNHLAAAGYVLIDPLKQKPQAGDVMVFRGHVGFFDPTAEKGKTLLSAAGAKTCPGETPCDPDYQQRSLRPRAVPDGVKYADPKDWNGLIYLRRIVREGTQ